MTPSESDRSLAAALGRIPSGLFVLTIRHDAEETGMLASWVQQCSFDPPQVTVAVKPGRTVAEWLTDGAAFGLNVLAGGQNQLIGHFAKGFDAGQPAFTGLSIEHSPEGIPVLADAHAFLACRVTGRTSAGDHDVIVGEVTAGRVITPGRPYVHVRKNGLTY